MLLKRGGVFEVQELMFACKLNATFHVDVTTWLTNRELRPLKSSSLANITRQLLLHHSRRGQRRLL